MRFEDSKSLSNMRGVSKKLEKFEKCKQYEKRLQEVGRL
jgi:hypothetical protein